MRVIQILMFLLAPSVAEAEIRFYAENKELELNSSGATKTYIETSHFDLEKICGGFKKADEALPDLINQTNFPLANNVYPASDFVAGFMEMAHWGRRVGYGPVAFELIWQNIAADKDKAFSKEERDNVVALWKHTMSWNPINCGAQ